MALHARTGADTRGRVTGVGFEVALEGLRVAFSRFFADAAASAGFSLLDMFLPVALTPWFHKLN